MMINHLLILNLMFLSIGYTTQHNSQGIREFLLNNSEWELLELSEEDGVSIYVKDVEDNSLNAVMVSLDIDLPPQQIMEVVDEVENYNDFLPSATNMHCELISRDDRYIYGYQYYSVPLFKNRHLVFRMDRYTCDQTGNRCSVEWILMPWDENTKSFVDGKIEVKGNPLYIEAGAGIWTTERLENGLTRASYRLYMDPAGFLPGFIVNKFNRTGLKGLFLDAIEEARKRNNQLKSPERS